MLLLPSAAIIDSQSVQGADTIGRSSRGYDAGKKTNARKRHIAVDTDGLLLAVVVTMAGIQDRDGAVPLLAALRARFSSVELVWADGGYAGRLLGWAKNVLALAVEVVKRMDDGKGFKVLPRRWWSSGPSRGSVNTVAASGTTRLGPTTTRRWSTSP